MSEGAPPGPESVRVEAFSDGVLAIAITLLVLDLHTGTRAGNVGHDLVAQLSTAALGVMVAMPVFYLLTADGLARRRTGTTSG